MNTALTRLVEKLDHHIAQLKRGREILKERNLAPDKILNRRISRLLVKRANILKLINDSRQSMGSEVDETPQAPAKRRKSASDE